LQPSNLIKLIFTGNIFHKEPEKPFSEAKAIVAIEEEIVPLKYRVEGVNFYQTLRGFDVYEKGEVTIRNLDDETGTFIVEQMFTTLNDGSTTLKHAYQILPAEEITFVEDYDIDASEDVNVAYNIIPGTKTIQKVITEYRDVTKYRESIRTVEKCD